MNVQILFLGHLRNEDDNRQQDNGHFAKARSAGFDTFEITFENMVLIQVSHLITLTAIGF